MKSKVILTMIYDIKLFPPVISICNILSELNYEIVYIGGCSDMNTEKVLMERNHVRFYKTPLYGGNGMQRIIQQWKYRRYVLEMLKNEYVKRLHICGFCILKQLAYFQLIWISMM